MKKDILQPKRAVDLRDRFAMAALQGLCASQTILEYIANEGVRRDQPGLAIITLPERAYRLADAMMAQRLLPNTKVR